MQSSLIGDVAGGSKNSPDLPLGIFENRGIERNQEFLSLFAEQRKLVVGDGPLVERLANAVSGTFRIRKVLLECCPHQIGARIPRHAAHGLVDVGDAQDRVHGNEAVQGSFDQAAVVGPLLPELRLQPRLLGDVASRGENTPDVSRGVFEDRSVERDAHGSAATPRQREDVVGDHAFIESFLDSRGGAFRVLKIIGEGRADQLLAAVPRHAAHLLIHIGNAAGGIDCDESVDGSFDQAAIVRLRFAQLLLKFFLFRDVTGGSEYAL